MIECWCDGSYKQGNNFVGWAFKIDIPLQIALRYKVFLGEKNDGKIVQVLRHCPDEYITISKLSNNTAEYNALLHLLNWLDTIGVLDEKFYSEPVTIYMDSQLVLSQVDRGWKINHEHLRELNGQCKEILKRFKCVRFLLIPREHMTDVDRYTR